MNPKNFFAELKRRNVYKVAVAYAIVGWLVMQIAATVVPALHLSDAITSAVVLLTILGFPIALVLAWAFELTPEGIKRTEDVPPNESITRRTGRKLMVAVAVLAGLAVGLVLFQWRQAKTDAHWRTSRSSTIAERNGIPKKSIAVLPFENLSGDPNNAYFSEGIQEEILTRLAKIGDLKVISRTSTKTYKSTPASLRDIAQQLDVSYVLEGSVQRAADQVRVTVQLVNALNDSHLWAETYDRKLIDVFQVESDVAQKIAASLEAKLTGRELHQITAGGTKNPQAYDAYLHALALFNKQGSDALIEMIQFNRRAVELDPDYAQAWAQLAAAEAQKYFVFETTDIQLERARDAAETALRLGPELADAHAAMGLFYYYCLQDFDRALGELSVASERAPNDGNILLAIGNVQRRQGRLNDALIVQEQAAKLDPLNEDIWVNLARTYRGTRKFEEAHAMFDRALAIAPDDTHVLAQKAESYLAQGDLEASWGLVSGFKFPAASVKNLVGAYGLYIRLLRDRRQFDEAITMVSSTLATVKDLPPLLVSLGGFALGDLHLLKGKREQAQAFFLQAERELKALRAQGDNGFFLADNLIEVEARLGHRDDAERDADALLQRTRKDAWRFPRSEEVVARSYAILGDVDRAIPLLKEALSAQYLEALTPSLLRLDPFWDPLRNDPRFQQLTVEKKP